MALPSFEWTVRKLIDCRLLGFADGAQAVTSRPQRFRNERLFWGDGKADQGRLGSFGEFGLNRLLIRKTLLNARPCLQAHVVRLAVCVSR
jgi:hypothetical protein